MTSCQVSLYPLGNPAYRKVVLEALKNLKTCGIQVDVNPMSTILMGEDEEVWKAVRCLYETGRKSGDVVMVVTLSSRCGTECKKDAENMG